MVPSEDDAVWLVGVEGDVATGGVVGCSAIVSDAGTSVRLHAMVDGAVVFEAEAEAGLRRSPVERCWVEVVEVSSRLVNGSGVLSRALVEHGFRRGRAVADEVVAVDAATIPIAGCRLDIIATERWGRVRRLTVRIRGGPVDDVPLWWVLDVDGERRTAMTDGLQSTTGGELGHLAMIH